MERIQFYPNKELKNLLEADARIRGVSISTLVTQMLQRHYGIAPNPAMTLAEAIPTVLDEVESYVYFLDVGETFDLTKASKTFARMGLAVKGKAATNRATVGKVFAAKVGTAPFENIALVYDEDGNVARSESKATLYVKYK